MNQNAPARLYVLLARESRNACIFRRGPSKQVLLIKWDRAIDTFEYGQWLKGRIYERRCDLSPSGDKLIYLAAKWKGPLDSWTAISKPPYLSALALWPNLGAWGGGGLFEYENTVCLNHRFDMDYDKLADGFSLPPNIKIKPLGQLSGHGEDDPIYRQRLIRDGWILISDGKGIEHPFDPSSPIWITYDPPITYERKFNGNTLRLLITGIKEWGGPWEVTEYAIKSKTAKEFYNMGRLEWADWDTNGDLLYTEDGKLYRYRVKKDSSFSLEEATELADFSELKFEEKEPPPAYQAW